MEEEEEEEEKGMVAITIASVVVVVVPRKPRPLFSPIMAIKSPPSLWTLYSPISSSSLNPMGVFPRSSPQYPCSLLTMSSINPLMA